MFLGCFKDVSRIFYGRVKSDSKVLERKLQTSFKQVSRLIQGGFKGMSIVLHCLFQEFSTVSQESFCCCKAVILATKAEGVLVFHIGPNGTQR